MGINALLLWLLGHPLPWHLGWLTNRSHQFLLVDLTLKWQTSLCSTVTNTAQWFRQLFLFSASKHFWNLPHFFSLTIAGTYQWLLIDKFLAGQGKAALWFYLAICPGSSAGSGSFWELPSCVFTELTYILRGFNRYISPTALRSFQKPGVFEFGVCTQTAEKPQIPAGKAAQTGIPWLKELGHHPHRPCRNTSLPWPETVSVGMKNLPGPPFPYVPDMSSVFCKITHFPCTTWQRKGHTG